MLVIDGVDVQRAVDKDILAEDAGRCAPNADIFPKCGMEANNTRDGKTYAVTEKFGYNTVSYDKTQGRSGRHEGPVQALVGEIQRAALPSTTIICR